MAKVENIINSFNSTDDDFKPANCEIIQNISSYIQMRDQNLQEKSQNYLNTNLPALKEGYSEEKPFENVKKTEKHFIRSHSNSYYR